LMSNGKPIGGKFSFDADNRKRWNGEPEAPTPLTFAVDPIKQEMQAVSQASEDSAVVI